jgi:hypothetical protein
MMEIEEGLYRFLKAIALGSALATYIEHSNGLG